MSVSRPFKWICNKCECTEERLGYGLPKGWSWYGGTVREPEIKHICEGCTDSCVTKLEVEKQELLDKIRNLNSTVQSVTDKNKKLKKHLSVLIRDDKKLKKQGSEEL